MCVKYIVLVLFQLYILVNPEVTTTVESIVLYEFEEVLTDFVLNYHKAKTDNATDIKCDTLPKYINENFIKSELYKHFQFQKYFAEDSKCTNICLNLNYEIKLNDLDHVTPIIPVSTVSDSDIIGTVTIDTVTDTISTEPASTENASTNTASTDIVTDTEGNQSDETTTVGSEGTDENVESENSKDTESGRQTQEKQDSGGTDENVESENSKDTESGRHTQEKQDSGEKKTAVIVAATIMTVGTVSVAFVPVVTWLKTLLQSGTYVFPGPPNV